MQLDGSSLEMPSLHLGRSQNIPRSQIGETGPGEARRLNNISRSSLMAFRLLPFLFIVS
jgi:hypothetical protein